MVGSLVGHFGSRRKLVVMLLVLQQRKWLVYAGCISASAVWCVLVLQQVLSFAGQPLSLLPIRPDALQTIALAVTSSFICALALRVRDYRLAESLPNPC